ncbi:Myb-like DNA-binding domain containing protein [Trichomonas vaginalis G3]|uniref:Myb-like DNA-binding domain containing protein n=1 Tax=Trichomonas vaginalis (strain ATCC PRA-98 / G3) TaxID=412133 RepID=A2G828_TRIV3|nr:RNA polymerase II transcription regulator recruiting protein [Trichomonas vaginalis G3]EAX86688.1 Myb-like DNA-binding domain containing protein [Trichomonas vaginalis G3]KAI5508219.1 RNA polymerase II transcription regulator recruiting protein [Trichomonas vaginalis G3]|eukprot:XP_001299618.1 Myb-like DNA-binding domain containing protein [Trichomonas vaginalis G3]
MTTLPSDCACSRKGFKALFTKKEDEKLIKLVKFYPKRKDINWKFISQQMGNRTVRQCKERFFNYLDNKINRSEFSPEENLFILQKVNEIGKKWTKISSLMKNRTDVAVKSQYKKLMRRNATLENVMSISTEPYSTCKSRKCVGLDEVHTDCLGLIPKQERYEPYENKSDDINDVVNTLFESIDYSEINMADLPII